MKYNQFGEVISVNGIITGQHLGSPMQDAIAKKQEDNQAYAIARNTQTTLPNSEGTWENQPKQSGGGSEQLNSLIDKSITEITSDVETIGACAFQECTELTTANFPKAEYITDDAFKDCTALESVYFPNAIQIGNSAFYNTKLKTVYFAKAAYIISYAFQKCKALTIADFPKVETIGTYAFQLNTNLKSLILRNETKVCSITNKNTLASTPIESGTGYIYVPSALIESYKAATNWSAYAAQFRALEDYTVDGTVTGALDETKI